MIFPRVCWTASPIIIEKIASEASNPSNSIFNSCNAKYNPANQITARKKNVINGLLPETVTFDFSVNLSITIGIMYRTETLAIVVDKIM